MTNKNKYLPYLMWMLPISFFTFQFILRLWPGLMMQPIMQQFMIDATGFGFLASLYYYGYAFSQVPLAIMLDRFGPRYVIFGCAILCGLATLLFNYTDNWFLACLSRLLIGIGSAVGFIGVSKVASEWFSKENYTKIVGYSFTIGLTGAIFGGKPVGELVRINGWQNVALGLACASIAIGILTFIFLRSPRRAEQQTAQADFSFMSFRKLLSSPAIWALALSNLLLVGLLEGFADVWGVQYLMTAHSLIKEDAAQLISFIFIGMIFGGPILAYISNKIGNYQVIMSCGVGMIIIFSMMLFTTEFHWLTFAIGFFLLGIMCCYQVVIFAAGSDLVSSRFLGVTIAFLNCINMLGGSFFHLAIGLTMDAFWIDNLKADGTRIYSLESFKAALLIIPICAVIGTIMVFAINVKLHKDRKTIM